MRYLVTGLCDVYVKPAGRAGLITFAVEHQFECDTLPSNEQLVAYAEKHGYKIGLSRNSGMGILQGHKDAVVPVYKYL